MERGSLCPYWLESIYSRNPRNLETFKAKNAESSLSKNLDQMVKLLLGLGKLQILKGFLVELQILVQLVLELGQLHQI